MAVLIGTSGWSYDHWVDAAKGGKRRAGKVWLRRKKGLCRGSGLARTADTRPPLVAAPLLRHGNGGSSSWTAGGAYDVRPRPPVSPRDRIPPPVPGRRRQRPGGGQRPHQLRPAEQLRAAAADDRGRRSVRAGGGRRADDGNGRPARC